MKMTRNELAKLLGAQISNGWLNVHGPGHSKNDRSLGIRFDPSAPDGFRVHSLAGEDPALCRKHVQSLLAKVASGGVIEMEETSANHAEQQKRIASALLIWQETLP